MGIRAFSKWFPFFVVLSVFMAGGCGESTPPSLDVPVVVIGVDSADWVWIDEHIADGRMPNLKALAAGGVRANLASLQPPSKSPTIWTSIATGKRPVKHGIAGFIDNSGRPENQTGRTAATYWEILGGLGQTQAVIGWWVTHPATRVNGALVSDYVQYYDGRGKQLPDATYPPELAEELNPLRVDPDSITYDDLARFLDPDIARAHSQEADKLLEELKWIYAADETFRRIAKHLYEPGRYDVFTVYFRGLDAVSHAYWRYYKPGSVHFMSQPWMLEMLGELIPRYHDYVDELLGEILEYIDPQSRVVLCSDHGFVGHQTTDRGPSLGVGMHRDDGILVMSGPGIRKGATLDRAGVKDIMPTLLAMRGIPPSRDVDGHVLGGAFEPRVQDWFDGLLADAVPSYDAFLVRADGADGADSEVESEILERLRSLGYID